MKLRGRTREAIFSDLFIRFRYLRMDLNDIYMHYAEGEPGAFSIGGSSDWTMLGLICSFFIAVSERVLVV